MTTVYLRPIAYREHAYEWVSTRTSGGRVGHAISMGSVATAFLRWLFAPLPPGVRNSRGSW